VSFSQTFVLLLVILSNAMGVTVNLFTKDSKMEYCSGLYVGVWDSFLKCWEVVKNRDWVAGEISGKVGKRKNLGNTDMNFVEKRVIRGLPDYVTKKLNTENAR
jgi:hypothetical protein